MICQVKLSNGKPVEVFASNGQESNLYKQLVEYYQGDTTQAIEKWVELNAKKESLKLEDLDSNGEPLVNSELYFSKDTSAIEKFYANEGNKSYADNKSTYNTVLRRLKKEYPSLANDIYGKKVSSGGGYTYKFAIRSNNMYQLNTPIKQGVSELFESNPELANEVYEALGIKQGFNTKGISIKFNDGDWNIIKLNDKRIGQFKFVDNGEKDILSLSIQINEDYQNKGYGQIVHIMAADLAKKEYNKNLYSDYQNSEQEIQLLKSLAKKGYAKQTGSIGTESKEFPGTFNTTERAFRIKTSAEIKTITPQQKQQAQQLYSQYLDTIFPDSKVKDIVYHGTSNKFEQFDFSNGNDAISKMGVMAGSLQAAQRASMTNTPEQIKQFQEWENKGLYPKGFTNEMINKAGFIKPLLFNLINPFISPNFDTLIGKQKEDFKNNDGFVITPRDEANQNYLDTGLEYLVFEPEQIHILGDKQDIKNFQLFVKNNNQQQKSSPETRPSDAVLNQKIKVLLEGIGVKTGYLENSRFKDLPVLGVADMFSKVAYVSMNKSRIDTLPEEASHFFVDYLEETKNPLFNSMMYDIEKYNTYMETYKEYQNTYRTNDGSPDVYKIKKEAIGKMIAKLIVDKNSVNEPQGLLERFTRWFNKVLDSIKDKLAKIGLTNEAKVENYFDIVASNILAGEYKGDFNSNGIYLQLSDKQKSLDGVIEQKDNEIRTVKKTDGEESVKEILKDGQWQYIKRVSEVVKEKGKYYNNQDTQTEIQKTANKNKALFGNKVHNDLMILLNQALGKEDNRPFMLSAAYHEKMSGFVDSIIEQFNPETHSYYTEVNVHNGKLAGTIDSMIVDANGKVNIFDYKSVTGLLDKQLSKSYSDKWYEQLTQYKNILRSYGVTEFGQTRVIPIAVNFSDKVTAKEGTEQLDYFQIGNNKYIDVEGFENLNPVPLPEERSGIKNIDTMIDKINDRIRQLSTKPTQENTYKIIELKKDIAKLQVSQSIEIVKDQAQVDLTIVQELIAKAESEGLDETEIKELLDLYNYYEDRLKQNLGFDSKGEIMAEVVTTTAYVQENKNKIDEILKNFNNTRDVSETIIKPSTWWNRLYKLSDYDIPAFQGLYKLLNRAFAQKEIRVGKVKDEVTEIINQIKQETDITDSKMFYPILQKDDDGKPNGKLIAQKNSEWFTFVNENDTGIYKNLESTSISYLKSSPLGEYMDLDKLQEYFNEKIATKLATLKGSNDSYKAESIKRYKSYLIRITVGNPNSKFYNTTRDNFTKFINPEYKKYIQDQPNSGLAKLYKKFIELNQYANENADANIRHTNLLPYVRKNTVKNLIDSGFNLRKLKDNVLNDLQTQEWESFELDSNGQKIYKVPLKYNTDESKRDLSQQSLDLGEVLVLWADAVYGNELMQKHHDTSLLFLEGLRRSKEFVTRDGKLVTKNGTIATKPVEAETLEQYIEYHNDAFYGQTSKDEDAEIMGMSRRKLARAATQYFSGTQLALNIFSGLSNLTGGLVNATTYAGNQYTKKQYAIGIKSIFGKDSKAYAAIKMFNVDSNIYDANQFKDVSVDKINKLFTWDKVFLLQKKGDWLMQNATLVAMMQNYTIKDNVIVKKTDEDKSLLELLEMDSNGKYKLPLENEEELFRFREKVRNVNSQIIGNTSEYDKQLAGNTLVGQLALQFRRWMLPMGVSRFGSLKYNTGLESLQYGKYRSTGKLLWETSIKQMTLTPLLEFIKKTEGGVLDQWLLEKYNQDLIQNPQLGTFADYKDLYHRNMKSTMMEASVLIGLIALKAALKADNGEEPEPWQRVLTRVLSRTTAENSFWFTPDSFFQIVQTPIPILNLAKNIADVLKFPSDLYASVIEDDDEALDKYDAKVGKLVIGYNAYLSFLKEIDKDE